MIYLLAIGGTIIFLDQVTKLLVLHFLPLHSAMEIIPGFFNLVPSEIPGPLSVFLRVQPPSGARGSSSV